MSNRVRHRQQLAWCFAAATVPAVMTCAGRPWRWVLAGCGAVAVFFWLIGAVMRQTGCERGLSGAVLRAFGPYFGGGLLVLSGIWALFAAADTAAACAGAFPDGGIERLAAPVLLALAAMSGKKGAHCAARCAAVAAPVLAGLYALILLCALPAVEARWCVPWGSWEEGAAVLAPMLLPMAALYLQRERACDARMRGAALAALALGPAAMAVVTAGCLSPQVTQEETFAFYALTKNMRLLSVMERFEPVLSASLVLGYFCLLTLLLESASAQIGAGIGKPRSGWRTAALCAAVYAGTFWVGRAPQIVRQIGAAVFWGVMPALALLIVAIKKVRKKAKKEVDKPRSL